MDRDPASKGAFSLRGMLLSLLGGGLLLLSIFLWLVTWWGIEDTVSSVSGDAAELMERQFTHIVHTEVASIRRVMATLLSTSATSMDEMAEAVQEVGSYKYVRSAWIQYPDGVEMAFSHDSRGWRVFLMDGEECTSFVMTPSGLGQRTRVSPKGVPQPSGDWLKAVSAPGRKWVDVTPDGRGLVVAKGGGTTGDVVVAVMILDLDRFFMDACPPRGGCWIVGPGGRSISRVASEPMRRWEARILAQSSKGTSTMVSLDGDTESVVVSVPVPGLEGWRMVAALPPMDSSVLVTGFWSHWLGVTFLLVLLVMGVGWYMTRNLMESLSYVINGANRLKQLNFSLPEPPPARFRELAEVLRSFWSMVSVLEVFRKYVPVELVRQILQSRDRTGLGGQARRLTIMFTDIENFTSITEGMDPYELTRYLGDYFQRVTDIIQSHRGTVDKFIGDGVMAFWGAPTPVPDPPRMACEAALECKKAIERLDEATQERPPFKTRFGIHEGMAIVGNVGSPSRFNYTALGDSVNLSSRLEGLNKLYGTSIIVSDSVHERVKERMECMRLDRVAVKGKEEPVVIYELMGLRGEVDERELEAAKWFEQTLDLYFQARFEEAAWRFSMGAEQFECKRDLFQLFAARAMNYAMDPPGPDWDGVFRPKVK